MYTTQWVNKKVNPTLQHQFIMSDFFSFKLEHALLMKHWTIPNILENLATCNEILANSGGNMPQQSPVLV